MSNKQAKSTGIQNANLPFEPQVTSFFQSINTALPGNENVAREISKHKKMLAAFSVASAIIIFGVVAFISYKYTAKPVDFNAIKLVKSDVNPVRVTPQEPGGVTFQNQDKAVYEAIEKSSNTPQNIKKVQSKKESVNTVKKAEKPIKQAVKKSEKQKTKSDVFNAVKKKA